MKTSLLTKTDAFRMENVYSAKKVLEQPEHFGPAMVDWARLVLSRPAEAVIEQSLIPSRPAVEKSGQRRLF
jgi:hypothetical protein